MKKVLLVISYYFPPFAEVGGTRSSKFVKYLKSFGWTPWVLTVGPQYYGERRLKNDPRSETDFPFANITRIPFIPFPGHVAVMKFLHAFIALFFAWWHRHQLNAVYICGSPYHAFILTALITRILGISSVIDFRDSWSINHGFDGRRSSTIRAKFRERFFRLIECYSIRYASKVVFTTTQLETEYIQLYPAWQQKYSTITNGFDPDDFVSVSPRRIHSKLTLILAGKLYLYSPQAVESLLLYLLKEPNIHFIYIGNEHRTISAEAHRIGVSDHVTVMPYLPYNDVLKLIAGADIGLVVTGMVNGMGTKIFDYLALGKPSVCLVPEDSVIAREFANAPQMILSRPPHTPERVARAIERALSQVGSNFTPNLARYSRVESTRQLAHLLDEIYSET